VAAFGIETLLDCRNFFTFDFFLKALNDENEGILCWRFGEFKGRFLAVNNIEFDLSGIQKVFVHRLRPNRS